MALHKCTLLLALGLVAVAFGEEAGTLQQLSKNTEEFFKKFSDDVNSIANGPNTEKLKSALKESSDTFLKQMSALSSGLQAALKDAQGEAKTALERAHADLEKSRGELEKRHPGVKASAEELRKGLQDSVEKVLEPTRALVSELTASAQAAGDKLVPHIKEAYDKFLEEARNVQNKLQAASKPN